MAILSGKQTYNVLLVEDNAVQAAVTKYALSEARDISFRLEHVITLSEAVARLSRSGIDVAIVDLMLPDSVGMETFQAIRSAASTVPVVVLTGWDDEQLALEMLKLGAQDYLVKDDVQPKLLIRSLRFALERQRVQTLESLNQQLEETKKSLIETAVQRQALVLKLSAARGLMERKNRRLRKLYRTAHRFVDNVSHEFRTPLTVIKEYVSLIEDGIVGPVVDEQRRMLRVVEDRADDLNTMVDDMLDSSKLEAGLLGVYRRSCPVAKILEHIWPALERKAAVRGVRLELEIAPHLPEVYCDPEKAGRVLINLTINGIKFCGPSGLVRLIARKEEDTGGVVLSVVDNGPGISPENQEAIFRRFKQVGVQARGSTKGFGLGLSIAKELVELNLGEISLDSEQGRGSAFSFTLPPADPLEVMRRYLLRAERLHNGTADVSLVEVEVDEQERNATDEVDEFLSYLLRPADLLFRAEGARWVVVLPNPECEFAKFCQRAQQQWLEANRNRIGGPLPELSFRAIGTWQVRSQRDEVMRALRAQIQAQETIYA